MIFHISVKKKVISRGVTRRFHCARCGYTDHDVFGFKETLSFLFVPVISFFSAAIRCHQCGEMAQDKQIKVSERKLARSLAFGLKDYVSGNFLIVAICTLALVYICIPQAVIVDYMQNREKYTNPYVFYDGCSAPKTGDRYVVNLNDYKPEKFQKGLFGVAYINGGRYPRVYNPETQAFEEKISLSYALSRPVYKGEENAIRSIQRGDYFVENYYDESQSQFFPLETFMAMCQKSFKAIRLLTLK